MGQKRMMNQVTAVFGIFMTVFYIGAGLYLALTNNLMIDKAVRNIIGFTFILYGVYRGFRSFQNIRDSFFRREIEDEEEE